MSGIIISPTKAKNYQRYNERIKGKRRNGGYYATTINAGFNAISRHLPEDDRIKAINEIRMAIHQVAPFVKSQWIAFCGLKTANLA